MTYYGRWTYKYEEAARQGAAAVLIIHQTKPASYGWNVVNNSFTGDKLYLQEADKHRSRCQVEGWLTEEAGNRLFQAAGLGITVDQATQNAGKRGFKAIPLGLTMSLDLDNKLVYSTSHNVIGILKAGKLPAQNIIYTAHWDHLGIGPKVNGDSIYNGAIDNASGVASVLAIAKAFTSLKVKLPRSIIFLFVTGEEQGLLGSEYYALHPLYPLNQTIADLNLDALGSYGPTKDISLVGLGQNDLEDYVKTEANRTGRYVVGDPNPGAGGYFRSDHFNFAKVGVPALDLGEGTESISKGSIWGKQMQEDYNDHHYHQPSDAYSPDLNALGMALDAKLLFRVGFNLSEVEALPVWKSGSEFKAIREKYMKKDTAQGH
jgi:Zn-dependent M28 family amino/carboxypeptidase